MLKRQQDFAYSAEVGVATEKGTQIDATKLVVFEIKRICLGYSSGGKQSGLANVGRGHQSCGVKSN